MEQNRSRTFINIGISSIIFIFIVFCLSVFALLSVNSARQSYASVQRNAEAVTAYYQADSKAQKWLHSLKQEGAVSEGILRQEFPISDSQTLSVAVDGETFELLSYQVINNEVLEIDDSLPVWQGEMEAVNP